MEEIIERIKNGRRVVAMAKIIDSSVLLEDVFEELLKQNMAEEIIIMYRVAIQTKYLVISK